MHRITKRQPCKPLDIRDEVTRLSTCICASIEFARTTAVDKALRMLPRKVEQSSRWKEWRQKMGEKGEGKI